MDVRTFRSESAFGGRPRILGKAASTSGGNSVLALDDLKSSSVHSGLSLSTMTEVFLRDRISCSLFLAHCAKTDGSQASTTYRKGKNIVVSVDLAITPISYFPIGETVIHKRRT